MKTRQIKNLPQKIRKRNTYNERQDYLNSSYIFYLVRQQGCGVNGVEIKYIYFRKLIRKSLSNGVIGMWKDYLIEITETKALESFLNPIRFK